MSQDALGPERIDELRRACGAEEAEVYLKRGRSRRFVRGAGLEQAVEASERGWAVRATTDRGSFFRCGTGRPSPELDWPEPDGLPIRLPEPRAVPRRSPPPEIEAPLTSESEMRSLVAAIEKELTRTYPEARLGDLVLEDGQSQSWIGSSLGLLQTWRNRATALTVEASVRGRPGTRVHLGTIGRDLRELSTRKVSQRLVDLLSVRVEGRPVTRDRSELVVAPTVMGRLLAGMWPLFDPDRSEATLRQLAPNGKLGGSALTVIDDGRLEQGPLAVPVDGEGLPTQPVLLVEEGVFRQPLLDWQAEAAGRLTGGCSQRFSWRDYPRVGPTHLFMKPDPSLRPTDLVGSLSRGYYLIDSATEGWFDYLEDRFSIPVSGFEMLGGRARSPISEVALVGKISGLAAGVRSVARDLTFTPTAKGLFGAPTVRLGGLEIREDR